MLSIRFRIVILTFEVMQKFKRKCSTLTTRVRDSRGLALQQVVHFDLAKQGIRKAKTRLLRYENKRCMFSLFPNLLYFQKGCAQLLHQLIHTTIFICKSGFLINKKEGNTKDNAKANENVLFFAEEPNVLGLHVPLMLARTWSACSSNASAAMSVMATINVSGSLPSAWRWRRACPVKRGKMKAR